VERNKENLRTGKKRIRLHFFAKSKARGDKPAREDAFQKRVTVAARDTAKGLKKRVTPIVGRKLQIGSLKIPVVFIAIAVLVILPIGMSFADEPAAVTDVGIGPKIQLYDVEFHPGTPSDSAPADFGTYTNGVPIKNTGNYWVSFSWKLNSEFYDGVLGSVQQGDYFYVTLDLGLDSLPAVVTEQTGTFATIIQTANPNGAGTITAGQISWDNADTYNNDKQIVLKLVFNGTDFVELTNGEDTDGNFVPVSGTGVWGFNYTAGSGGDGNQQVTWQVLGSDPLPAGEITVVPEPPIGQKNQGVNKTSPYNRLQNGYIKMGTRLTPANTPTADTIYYWNVMINVHKHSSIEDWQANATKYGTNDPAPTFNTDGTFTIIDEGMNMAPTWLRSVSEASDGSAVIDPGTPVSINRQGGFYGQSVSATSGPAYIKLFYVNSEYIWAHRIDIANSSFAATDTDRLLDANHWPSDGHPVGQYDPYFTNGYMANLETSAVLYSPYLPPNDATKYAGYLTPVPSNYIKAIRMTDNGFEIDVDQAALFNNPDTNSTLGNTIAVAYMTMPSPDSQGYYHNVSNALKITDEGSTPVVSATGGILLGGTINGLSPNKGKFIIEKRDLNTTQLMPGVQFDVVASSNTQSVADDANALIADLKANSATPGKLVTGQNGKIVINLPPLPLADDLTLTITETPPTGYIGVGTYTAKIDRISGQATITPATGFTRYVQLAADKYGSIVWNRSAEIDKSYYDVALRKWVKMVNRDINGETYNVYYNENPNTDVPPVKNGDQILFRVDVYNQCFNDVIIPSISDWLPAGLTFDDKAQMDHYGVTDDPAPYDNSAWKLIPGTNGAPDKLEYVGDPIHLPARTNVSDPYPEYRIPLILTVNVPDNTPDQTLLTNIARITELQDGSGKPVEDIDSFIEDERDKDAGPSPGIDYGNDIPPGTVDDNNIEEHHKTPDGVIDNTQDEDTHDYASVVISNPTIVACQVDKDTIRRTSAAYVSPTDDPLSIDNVKQESYLYKINFRSLSTLPADEFVVDDPLENVSNDQNHILALWTPAVWGDQDGRMNVWYKTKNGSGDSAAPPTGTGPNGAITQVANPIYPTNTSDGWKLWQTVVEDPATFATNGGVIERVRLNVEDLNLSSGDYITALRFEYGAVKVGFTSKNNSSISLNGEHRTPDGSLNLDPMDYAKVAQPVANKMPETAVPVPLLMSTSTDTSGDTSGGNFFTQLFGAIFGSGSNTDTSGGAGAAPVAAGDTAFGVGGPTDTPDTVAPGGAVDWTPSPADPSFAVGALNAQGLAPATYLVECLRPMTNENIVSSAIAMIANGALYDQDVDAVVTNELTTFIPTEKNDNKYTLSSSFSDQIPRLTPNTETTVGGRSARTYDAMNPLFWIGTAASALAAAGMVFLLWVRRRRRILAAAHARRRHTR